LIGVWLLVLLLVGVPDVARLIGHVWFVHRRHVLDHDVPDDLPMTAGEWLADELRLYGLAERIRIVVTNHVTSSQDAFHVQRGVIQLTEETNFKRDPVYWAIAAHELGHARFRLDHPASIPLSITAQLAKLFLVRFGLGLALGNTLFAIPLATQLAHWMFGVALALHVFELGDEIVASTFAMRMLRADTALLGSHIRAARSVLIAAFLTYLLPFVGYVVMFSQWWIVERLTATPRMPSGGVTTLGLVGAAFASLYVLVFALAHLAAAARRPRLLNLQAALLSISWAICVVAVILLGWDRHLTTTHAWIVMLACSAAYPTAMIVLALPSSIALSVFAGRARRYDPGIELSSVFRSARLAGAETTKAGNHWLKTVVGDIYGPVPAARRIWELNKLAILALVIAFWL